MFCVLLCKTLLFLFVTVVADVSIANPAALVTQSLCKGFLSVKIIYSTLQRNSKLYQPWKVLI